MTKSEATILLVKRNKKVQSWETQDERRGNLSEYHMRYI